MSILSQKSPKKVIIEKNGNSVVIDEEKAKEWLKNGWKIKK